MVLIAPSLLATDFARLGEALRLIKEARASMVHVDVSDGHFVPGITVGQPVVKSLRKATNLVLDVHLLIERPERFAAEFVKIGANRVAVHAEATPNIHHALCEIRNGGAQAGLALNPSTSVQWVVDVLGVIDYLVILSADLGFKGSPFLAGTQAKVHAACALRRERHLDFAIQVEGGIGRDQVEPLGQSGADILVADSNILQDDPKTRLAAVIRQAATLGPVSQV